MKTLPGQKCLRLLVTWLVVLACVGCKVGPEYRVPWATLPDDWSQQYHPRFQGELANLAQWWQHFDDPVLDQLIVSARGFHLDGGRRLVGFDLPLRRHPWYDDLIWAWPSSGES